MAAIPRVCAYFSYSYQLYTTGRSRQTQVQTTHTRRVMKRFRLSDKQKKAFKDYGLAVLAAAVTMGIGLATELAPQYAVLIGALAAPLVKWASKNSKDYGVGTK
jgi:hypothetical protein